MYNRWLLKKLYTRDSYGPKKFYVQQVLEAVIWGNSMYTSFIRLEKYYVDKYRNGKDSSQQCSQRYEIYLLHLRSCDINKET